jgi:hypothetical protein
MGDPIFERARGAAEGWHRSVGQHVLNDRVPGWAELAFDEARQVAQRRDEEQLPQRRAVLSALNVLRGDVDFLDAVARAGLKRLQAALLFVSDGDRARAIEVFREHDAEFDARRRALEDPTIFKTTVAQQQDLDLEAITAGLESVSQKALVAAVPILLAVTTRKEGA